MNIIETQRLTIKSLFCDELTENFGLQLLLSPMDKKVGEAILNDLLPN